MEACQYIMLGLLIGFMLGFVGGMIFEDLTDTINIRNNRKRPE